MPKPDSFVPGPVCPSTPLREIQERNMIPKPEFKVPDIIEKRPPILYKSSPELINKHLVDTP